MLDPGFRQPVRSIRYNANWMTRDNRFQTPVNSYSVPRRSCTRSESYTNIADASSYADSMAVDASISAEGGFAGFGAAFKASAGYKRQSNAATASNLFQFDSKSYCLKYHFAWLHSTPKIDDIMPQFVDFALEALESLEGRDVLLLRNDAESIIFEQAQAKWCGRCHTLHICGCLLSLLNARFSRYALCTSLSRL